MKKCNRCGGMFDILGFHKNKGSADGHLGICKSCVGVRQRAYVLTNSATVAIKMKAYHLANRPKLLEQQREYKKANKARLAGLKRQVGTGFSPALFTETLAAQGNRCAICGIGFRHLSKQQCHADHCHATGNPRGVLCQSCNTAMGKFGDNPDLLRRAAEYLENPPVKATTFI